MDTLETIARERGMTGVQLAIAWVFHQGKDIVPLLGSRTRKQLGEAMGALEVRLTAGDLKRIADAIPAGSVAGTRYDARQMAMLDSERNAKAMS